MKRFVWLIPFLVLSVLGTNLVTFAADTSYPFVKVSLRLPWVFTSQFAGVFVAAKKGYFAEEGLQVDIQPGGIGISSIPLVAGGADDFGIHDAASLIKARQTGMPLVAVANIFQEHPGAVFALASSGISKPEDLVGKTVGTHVGGPDDLTKAMLRHLGISVDSVHWVNVGYDITPLLTGKIDALTCYATNEPVQAEVEGYKVNVISPYDYGIKTFSDVLFTTEKMIKAHPVLVYKMTEALLRGWAYALSHLDETADIVLSYNPNLKRAQVMGELQAEKPLIITDDTKVMGLGWMSQERWSAVQDVVYGMGQLPAKINVSSIFTTRFLPHIIPQG